MVPVTTMEELPVLSDEERAELLAALAEAEASISAGKGSEYDPATFKARLVGTYRDQQAET